MTTPKRPTLREVTKQAWDLEQVNRSESEAEWEAENSPRTLRKFVQEFGIEPDAVHGLEVECDNITLRMDGEGLGWYLKGVCPDCGKSADSRTIYNAADLYELLNKFQVGYLHHCASPAPETIGERLEALIREFIREELESR